MKAEGKAWGQFWGMGCLHNVLGFGWIPNSCQGGCPAPGAAPAPWERGGKVPAWKPPGDTLGAQPAGTRKRRGAVCAEEVAQGRGEAGPESPL